jgi:hypothetical protein
MISLIVEENQVWEKGQVILDFPAFLKVLPSHKEITLIFKTHDALYYDCPLRKAVPFLKSAEFSTDHWVGTKSLSNSNTFIAGILPSPFMQQIVTNLYESSFAVKGAYVWADLIVRSFGSAPMGWTIIYHDQHLFVTFEGILRFSRPCFLSLTEELPATLRYLKRFGYEKDTPINLITSAPLAQPFEAFINHEIHTPLDLSSQGLESEGLKLQISRLKPNIRLYHWPRKIRKSLYAFLIFNVVASSYLGWGLKNAFMEEQILKHKISIVPHKDAPDESQMKAFTIYRNTSKDTSDPLSFIKHLFPLIKEEAVATYVHWTPDSLNLHLQLNPTTIPEQLWLTLKSQFRDHQLTWQEEENDPLRGVLIISKKNDKRSEVE